MEFDAFTLKLKEARQRTQRLENAIILNAEEQDLLAQTLEELHVAIEELQVSEEELRQQNEELGLAYEKLQVERQRYLKLFEFAPDAYIVTDKNGKILEANDAAVKLLKVSPQFLEGKLLISFIPREDRRYFRSQLLRLSQYKQLQNEEIHVVSRTGENIDVSMSTTTQIYPAVNNEVWFWLLRNITLRKQSEEQLRSIKYQNSQLQEVIELKSQFIRMMSHELRTPMNAILGYAQLLLRQKYDDSEHSPKAKMMVEQIFESGKRLLKLIEDLLQFSALGAQKLKIIPKEFDVKELIGAIIEEMLPLAQQKHLYLDTQFEIENSIINHDCDRLRQVIVNLVANGIKFTENGGVLIKVKETDDDKVVISVVDTGIGIPEFELKSIFREFYQSNYFTASRPSGTGLGLAIAEKLLRLMNGKITVESKVGEGSNFHVELPKKFKENPS